MVVGYIYCFAGFKTQNASRIACIEATAVVQWDFRVMGTTTCCEGMRCGLDRISRCVGLVWNCYNTDASVAYVCGNSDAYP